MLQKYSNIPSVKSVAQILKSKNSAKKFKGM